MADETVRDFFVLGLKNAHAMEHEALGIMNRQVERLERYPEMEERLRAHIEETHGQIDRLDRILESLGETHSAFKDTITSIGGNLAALGHTPAGDEILKNSFANYAFENYEQAAYKGLILIGKQGSFSTALPLLEETLEQERAMADFIDRTMPTVVERFLSLKAVGEPASH